MPSLRGSRQFKNGLCGRIFGWSSVLRQIPRPGRIELRPGFHILTESYSAPKSSLAAESTGVCRLSLHQCRCRLKLGTRQSCPKPIRVAPASYRQGATGIAFAKTRLRRKGKTSAPFENPRSSGQPEILRHFKGFATRRGRASESPVPHSLRNNYACFYSHTRLRAILFYPGFTFGKTGVPLCSTGAGS